MTRQNSSCTPESIGVSAAICTHVEGASKMDTSLSKVTNGDANCVIINAIIGTMDFSIISGSHMVRVLKE